jgi:cytochrome c
MNAFEVNKFAGGGLAALLTATIFGFIGNALVAPHPLPKNVYVVDVATAKPVAAAAPAALDPIAPLLAAASVDAGRALSRQCTSCHTLDKAGRHGVGPNLWDALGGAKARVQGFGYSQPMIEFAKKPGAEGSWGYEQLNAFLANPRAHMPGTKMAFAGLRRAEDRAAMIAFLRSLSDAPKPLP